MDPVCLGYFYLKVTKLGTIPVLIMDCRVLEVKGQCHAEVKGQGHAVNGLHVLVVTILFKDMVFAFSFLSGWRNTWLKGGMWG